MSKSEHIQVFYMNKDELAAFCHKQKKTYITGDSHLKTSTNYLAQKPERSKHLSWNDKNWCKTLNSRLLKKNRQSHHLGAKTPSKSHRE